MTNAFLISFMIWFNASFNCENNPMGVDVNIYYSPYNGNARIQLINFPGTCGNFFIKISDDGTVGYCCVDNDPPL